MLSTLPPLPQGGFIWDWVDQALLKRETRADGSALQFWAYGGDYGDEPNDAQVCCRRQTQPEYLCLLISWLLLEWAPSVPTHTLQHHLHMLAPCAGPALAAVCVQRPVLARSHPAPGSL